MVRPFLSTPDILGVGATIRIANGSIIRGGRVMDARVPIHWLSGFQVVEYLRAFLFGRLGWNRFGGNLIISGAFGLFRRESLLAAGGLCHDTIGEDFELVMKLRARACDNGQSSRVVFVPDPIAWTEAPASVRVLGRQRDRWHRGLADVVSRYRRVLFNPRYGVIGFCVFPHYAILELFAPVVEGVGLIALILAALLGLLNAEFAMLFFLTVYGFGVALTLATLLLEEFTFCRYHRPSDRVKLVAFALCDGLGYRQLTVFWRIRGLVKFLRGQKEWGVMDRRGFQAGAGHAMAAGPQAGAA
jgi:cellulose synthase/poly-beta-1,6-N-acetylglucosamine synthase-like glycosyltransferase